MLPVKIQHKIVFVEDRSERLDLIREAFERSGNASLEVVTSPEGALDVLKHSTVSALFFSKKLCGGEESDFVRDINKDGQRDMSLIMVSEGDDEEAGLRAIRFGIDDFVTAEPEKIDGYPAVAVRAIVRRDALRRQAEQTNVIIRSQKRWMSILDAITDYIFVIDDQHRLLNVNRAFAAVFNMHPRKVVGKKCCEIFGADFVIEHSVDETQQEGKPRTYEKKINEETYQVSVFPLHEGNCYLTIHVMKNITELRRLKEQLHHADKLASIGLLVSGVAHEINNPLTGTIAYTELLTMKVSDEDVKQDLIKIADSAERCKKIVDNLLTFSRQRTPAKSLETINDIIDRAIDLRKYWLRSYNIEVVKHYDPVSTVFVDSQQLQEVVLNILLNAEQAIVDSGQTRGKITFTTRYNKEERMVLVRIVDNGPGIPQRIISKIFDPFFTTKPVGVGTGLGLSISHGIVTEHGGTIRFDNIEGGGAAFIIELPTGAGLLQGESELKQSGQLK